MIHIEDESINASIEELKKMKERVVSAFQILKGLGSKTENLENAIKTTQLKVFSEVLIQSYDGAKITPIPDICHEPTSEARVNFFGRCKFLQI